MLIKPLIRNNVLATAHPLGIEQNIKHQIEFVKNQESFKGPKNVLIIGGSSGYGLASRIALTFAGKSNTVNVSYENGPKGKMTGTAGHWNNYYFNKLTNIGTHYDFVGDAFSFEMKNKVISYLKNNNIKIDLVIYSLASGVRKNPETGEIIKSSLKTIGSEFIGKTVDIKTKTIKELTVQPATESEIKDTIYVMGGDDWSLWINSLLDNNCLNLEAKTISYTYIGGEVTAPIYREGTIGKAKIDLENTQQNLNKILKTKINGEALISSSKAVTTKASVFIPGMALYMSSLYDVMLKKGTHESIIEHKYRLFKDMIYGNNIVSDDLGRIRLDYFELRDEVQDEVIKNLKTKDPLEIINSPGGKIFYNEFYQMNGFNVEGINYDDDVEIQTL